MNVIQRKLRCTNHKAKFEKQDGSSVTYYCGQCGWRGRFGVSSTAKAGR